MIKVVWSNNFVKPLSPILWGTKLVFKLFVFQNRKNIYQYKPLM